MGQIRDLFKSDFSIFWLGEPKYTEMRSEKVLDLMSQNVLKCDLKSPGFLPFRAKSDIPERDIYLYNVVWFIIQTVLL